MNRDDFDVLFDKMCQLHEEACRAAMSKDPEWELQEPLFILGIKTDDDAPELVPAALPPGLSPEACGALARLLVQKLLSMPPDELAKGFKHRENGRTPERVELLAAGFLSEGWNKDVKTGERLEELSVAVLEDRDYHGGFAHWTKDVENARLVLRQKSVVMNKYDVDSNLGNLFKLEPREYAH